jgi:uroporphyrinogen decarboxylase
MNGLERMRKALRREEPDRVPHFELLVDKKVRDVIKPGLSNEDFHEYMDIDGIGLGDKNNAWSHEVVDEAQRLYRDHWGAIIKFSTEAGGIPQEPALKSDGDFDKYVMPDPDEDWRYDKLRETVKRFKGERAVLCGVTDVFDVAKEHFLGDVAMFMDMIRNPDLVKRMSEKVLDYQLRYIDNCLEVGADFFFINGDYATTHYPMVSPRMAGEFLMPYLKALVDRVHLRGSLAIKHSDGQLWPLFDQIVATGVDGIHPIDPEAGMDMGEAKARYGDKICLLGNVDCGPLLTWGTPDEVRQETKECIRKGGKGGGLVCMSSNSIHSGVKPENYLAMLEIIHKYGTYPLEDHFDNLVEPGSGHWS